MLGHEDVRALRRIRKRKGRCYELTVKALTSDDPEAVGARLVHGTVSAALGRMNHPYPWIRMDHAWIVLADGRIYDPVLDKYFTASEFKKKVLAVAKRTYTRRQLVDMVANSGHSGPWHNR